MAVRTRSEPALSLVDRQRERAALDGLLGDLRSGRGRALVVGGEAGGGKWARVGAASAGGPGRGGGIRDGAGVRRPASAVRAPARSPGAASAPAARCAGG